MKKIIPLLGIILLLTSCYSNPKDLEKITELENKIQSDLFEKKQECSNYKDDMKKDAISNNVEWMNITGDPYDLVIEEIFYSNKINSCIYELGIYKYIDIGNGNEKILLNKYLYDYLSKKELTSTITDKDNFEEKLLELKN